MIITYYHLLFLKFSQILVFIIYGSLQVDLVDCEDGINKLFL